MLDRRTFLTALSASLVAISPVRASAPQKPEIAPQAPSEAHQSRQKPAMPDHFPGPYDLIDRDEAMN